MDRHPNLIDASRSIVAWDLVFFVLFAFRRRFVAFMACQLCFLCFLCFSRRFVAFVACPLCFLFLFAFSEGFLLLWPTSFAFFAFNVFPMVSCFQLAVVTGLAWEVASPRKK